MNSHQDNVVEEENPQLRSVKIGSLTALPPLSRSFASPTKLQQQHQQQSTLDVRKQQTSNQENVPNQEWIVDDKLPVLPAYYVLERTNVYVENCTSQEVANRISSSLREESIASTSVQDEKNALQAENNQGCKFVVRLFADEGCVVVEVQRLKGCSFEFRQACREVCRSAKGLGVRAPKRKLTVPSSILRCGESSSSFSSSPGQRIRSGLESAKNMLKSDRLDSQLMGLESLEKLSSNPIAVSTIFGEECLELLLRHLEEPAEPTSEIQQGYTCLMRRRCLTILANCLLTKGTEIPSDLSSEAFVRKLMSFLKNSSRQPHEACQAARCIQALYSSNTTMQSLLRDLNILSTLSSSVHNHFALEQESNKLHTILLQ